ncbi:MAG: hypothetical protein ACJ79R_18415, partial [Anaeromyxobacteraceae bacterium]
PIALKNSAGNGLAEAPSCQKVASSFSTLMTLDGSCGNRKWRLVVMFMSFVSYGEEYRPITFGIAVDYGANVLSRMSHEGDFRKIVNGINQTLAAIVVPLGRGASAARAVSRVA